MHETGLAIEIAKLAQEALMGVEGTPKVSSLHLKVGRWSGAEPQTLEFALKVVLDDTELAGAKVELELVEPTFHCPDCDTEYVADHRLDPCPKCGGLRGVFVAGDELLLTHLEIED